MPLEFQAQVRDKDMYRFNMYHVYTSGQGLLAQLAGLGVIAAMMIVALRRHLGIEYLALYVGLAVVFAAYLPVSLWFRSKRQIAMSEALSQPLRYALTEEGIVVTSPVSDEPATLPWDGIYKVVSTRSNLLIYSSRVNAYVVPRAAVEEIFPQICGIIKEHVADYRLHLK